MIKNQFNYGKTKNIWFLGFFGLLFLTLAFFTNLGFFDTLDQRAISFFEEIRNPTLDRFMIFLTEKLASNLVLFGIAFLIGGWLFFRKEIKKAELLIFSILFGAGLVQVIKYLIQRARPIEMLIAETGYSFPSSHATLSLILLVLLIYFFKDKLKNIFLRNGFIVFSVVSFLLIGLSRVYVKVHYFSDVISGFVLGTFVFLLSDWLIRKLNQEQIKD